MQICSHLVPSLKLIINSFLTVQIFLFFVDDIVIVMKYIYLSEYASFNKSRVIIKNILYICQYKFNTIMQELIKEITLDTIKSRHSVRRYTEEPLSEEHNNILKEIVDKCNASGNFNMQLITDEPNAFGKSFFARYGKFYNVRNYICLIGPKAKETEERLGYYGEIVVLKAQQLGINSCWCGLSYSKSNAIFKINDGEKLYALIALGYGENQGVQHKSKSPDKISSDIASSPEWYLEGIEAALLGPSAVNQQKFHFRYINDNRVAVSTDWGFYNKTDIGIAKLHFEIGSQKEISWI